jgi:hypothetical protein
MRTLRITPFSLSLLAAANASAQAPAPAQPPAAPIEAPAAPPPPPDAAGAGTIQIEGNASLSPDASTADAAAEASASSGDAAIDPVQHSRVDVAPENRTGFSAGLRLGVGVPLGKAGENPLTGAGRDVSDLTPWRAPVWVDIGYALSGALTISGYAQVGVGGIGDDCIDDDDCDWSDIRVGAEAEWRFAPGAPVNPWLGVGLGWEWLSFRQLVSFQVPDGMGGMMTATGRVSETFGGPELMLQGGIDFQVEDALRIGPYASATVSQYLTDSFSCTPASELCPPDGSIDGAAFHSWIGVGLRGAYTP